MAGGCLRAGTAVELTDGEAAIESCRNFRSRELRGTPSVQASSRPASRIAQKVRVQRREKPLRDFGKKRLGSEKRRVDYPQRLADSASSPCHCIGAKESHAHRLFMGERARPAPSVKRDILRGGAPVKNRHHVAQRRETRVAQLSWKDF